MKIIDLGPHERMTPEEALKVSLREKWSHVLILGFHEDEESPVVRSSHMTREFALWLIEHGKLHAMGRL